MLTGAHAIPPAGLNPLLYQNTAGHLIPCAVSWTAWVREIAGSDTRTQLQCAMVSLPPQPMAVRQWITSHELPKHQNHFLSVLAGVSKDPIWATQDFILTPPQLLPASQNPLPTSLLYANAAHTSPCQQRAHCQLGASLAGPLPCWVQPAGSPLANNSTQNKDLQPLSHQWRPASVRIISSVGFCDLHSAASATLCACLSHC